MSAWVRAVEGPGLWDGEIDGLAGTPVDLSELVVGTGEADLESFDFAGPAAWQPGLADPGMIRLSRISAMRGRRAVLNRERRRPSKPTTGSRPMSRDPRRAP
jgi:hypothetical protein